jgi:hypothetical protein
MDPPVESLIQCARFAAVIAWGIATTRLVIALDRGEAGADPWLAALVTLSLPVIALVRAVFDRRERDRIAAALPRRIVYLDTRRKRFRGVRR